jgi:hypothetical protein
MAINVHGHDHAASDDVARTSHSKWDLGPIDVTYLFSKYPPEKRCALTPRASAEVVAPGGDNNERCKTRLFYDLLARSVYNQRSCLSEHLPEERKISQKVDWL